MLISRSARAALLGTLTAALSAGAAHAQAPVEACPPATEVASDPAGDAKLYNVVPAPDSLDIRKVALRPSLDAFSATVTFTVTNLDKTVPPNSTGLSWYLEYTVDGAAQFVAADLAPDGTVKFSTGTDGQTYTPTGSTTGTFDEATDTISIVIPDAYWGADLTTMRAVTYEAVGVDIPGVGSAAFLPGADTAAVSNYTVGQCEVPEEEEVEEA